MSNGYLISPSHAVVSCIGALLTETTADDDETDAQTRTNARFQLSNATTTLTREPSRSSKRVCERLAD